MYIDIQKFKNGQLYSRPEWNTGTKKESILCEGLNVYLLMAILEGKSWSVSKEDYVMSHGFLFDDYFEVNDPLHFYQEKRESQLKKAFEEMQKSRDIKDILTVPCGGVNERSVFGNPYMQYGTWTPIVSNPPVTSTVCSGYSNPRKLEVILDTGVTSYMGYYLGFDSCNSVELTEKRGPLQIIKHKGFDEIRDKEFLEELVKLSQYYKDVEIEDDKL